MTRHLPAEIGAPLADVDTPALLLDLDAFERNLRHLSARAATLGVRLRPHAKTHKSPVIALKQIALGAIGVCCQKVSEAEALVEGGVRNVLVSNEVVGRKKLGRLAVLARDANIGVCVDAPEHIDALSSAAQNYGVTLDVLVEIDVGAGRCGVQPGDAALALAQLVSRAKGLRFRGLQAYHGSAQHLRGFEERRLAIKGAVDKVQLTRQLLERHDLVCEEIGGGGTGTYAFEGSSGVYTDLQAGSYIFMDADYAKNLADDGKPVREFEHSLFVYATVMSTAVRERAVLDAGLKAVSVDSGMPRLAGRDDAEYFGASDEHGKLKVTSGNRSLTIGDKVKLIPGHCDPTVNLYDWYVGYRGERVEAIWPIARGPGA
ncbi:MAG TPA: DSD1 family PLP-dependent enzyme [Alphaproteobacteria bacterium]|nr:DSD1 family PLP-dependent enzyme [Alphaproteobacteria bacterium]